MVTIVQETETEQENWQLLWKQLRDPNCTLCPLHQDAQFVCLMGVGPVPCDYMIIGENPGWHEDQESHRPFTGDSGKLLNSVLADAGLSRGMFFISNTAKCKSPFNRDPEKKEIMTCWNHYGVKEMEAVKPKIVILMGRIALGIIGKTKITEVRGQEFPIDDKIYLPMLHPAYALRNPGQLKYIKEDFLHFKRLAGLEQTSRPTKTFLVTKRKAAERLVQKLMKSQSVAYDLETEGLDPFIPGKRIWTIQLSDEDGIGYVLPLEHPEYMGTTAWAYDVIKPLLERKENPPVLVGHNVKFDIDWLLTRDIKATANFDTLQAAHLLDENRKHDLQSLSQAYFSVLPWGKVKQTGTLQPMRELAPEGAKDADYDRRLYCKQREELRADPRTLRIFQYISAPAVNTLAEIEVHGVPIDLKKLQERGEIAIEQIETSKAALEEFSGNPGINWNSSQQKARVLFSDPSEGGMGLPIVQVTEKTKKPSTDKSTMKELQFLLEEDTDYEAYKDIVPLLFEYTKWTKWKSTFFDAWLECVTQYGEPILHPVYNIEGTRTGRISAKNPNIQQTPTDTFMRGMVGGVPGWLVLEADLSQIEMRNIAMISGDRTLKRVYLTGGDVHTETAMAVSGISKERITSDIRKKAKAVNFGFCFGMGAEGFRIYARDNYDILVSQYEAEEARSSFFSKYYSLSDWHENARRTANKLGYIRSPLGRKRNLPDLYSSDRGVRALAERQAINSPVQSLASDITVLSMNIFSGQVRVQGYEESILDRNEIRMFSQVHDSILFLVREDAVMKWARRIKWTMENLPLLKLFNFQPTVPIEVDLKVGTHWSEGAEEIKVA